MSEKKLKLPGIRTFRKPEKATPLSDLTWGEIEANIRNILRDYSSDNDDPDDSKMPTPETEAAISFVERYGWFDIPGGHRSCDVIFQIARMMLSRSDLFHLYE